MLYTVTPMGVPALTPLGFITPRGVAGGVIKPINPSHGYAGPAPKGLQQPLLNLAELSLHAYPCLGGGFWALPINPPPEQPVLYAEQ